jgi:hypothetical protein
VLLIETEAGDMLQVTGLVAPVGELVTEQARDTVPVNEVDGVTVTVEVLLLAPPGVTLMLPLLESVKLLLVFGASQKLEQPTEKATRSGTAASDTRPHFPVFISLTSLTSLACTG